MSSAGEDNAGFPQLGTPFVDEHLDITIPWYRLLVQLFRLAGSSQVPVSQAVYFMLQNGSTSVVEVISVQYGLLGPLQLTNLPGGPVAPQTLTTSPFVFTAPVNGAMVVFSGKVEVSRDSGVTYYTVSLTGGSIGARAGDKIRISWTGAIAPQASWWPNS